jgi:hypothetical protein
VNATDAALLGALVGAGLVLVGSVLTSLVSWRIERARQQAAKAAADVETLRRHTADAFSELFALNHAISWITWFAEYAPHAVNQQMKASFDAETHDTFPRVLAAMTMVASVSQDFYSDLRLLQKRVFDLWSDGATVLHREPGPDIAMLAECWPRAEELDDDLPDKLQQMIEKAE